MFFPGKPFKPSLMFVVKVKWIPNKNTFQMLNSRVGSSPYPTPKIRLGWRGFARDKHSGLLQTFVKYGRKKFHYIDPKLQRREERKKITNTVSMS